MAVHFYESADNSVLKFAVIVAKYRGKYIFCRHRERETWEIPGGHREVGEPIDETARRELWEETGAEDFTLRPVCVYSVTEAWNFDGAESFGMLYFAEVQAFGSALSHEIGELRFEDELPERLTYPTIQPQLLREAERRGFS